LIVGLGNIGKKYENTRHNFGFLVLDALVHTKKLSFKESSKFQGEWCSHNHSDHEKVFYLKPHTYMNLSGASVYALTHYYKINSQDIFVIYDDVDMSFGSVRIARSGGAGGHRGIQSIIDVLGTNEIPRMKLGIGRPVHEGQEVADHVLDKFSAEEMKEVASLQDLSTKAIEAYLSQGIDVTMNRFNKVIRPAPKKVDE
ncbi:MAG TPA: aminoacyl-tRNA hydrolase, partial [bacterium]|nr:aminoacyl-tRNA hydrolase [bacterium]